MIILDATTIETNINLIQPITTSSSIVSSSPAQVFTPNSIDLSSSTTTQPQYHTRLYSQPTMYQVSNFYFLKFQHTNKIHF